MSEMHPGDRAYRNQVVRLTDLTVTSDMITGATFENCTLVGPAVIALLGSTSLINSGFDGEMNAVLWPLGDREQVVGAIGLVDCTLSACRFQRIGLAFTTEQDEKVRQGFTGG